MFGEAKPFPEKCQEEYVPPLLLAQVSIVLGGPSIKDQMADSTRAALAIAQNADIQQHQTQGDEWHHSTRHCQTHRCVGDASSHIHRDDVAHSNTQEVDKLSQLGMCISYDRVLRLSTQIGNIVCQQFHREQVIGPPKMRDKVFTTAAVYNIDHNPSATTAKESFHGTATSFADERVDRSIAIV